MAQRRMFSPEIVTSDAFLEMPPSTQALYFQFGMKADDDGFVNPKMVMRMMGSTDDELKVLISKKFVLPFENGIIVIKHWKVNNMIRKDWYKPTNYVEQKNKLFIKENNAYTLDSKQGVPMLLEMARQRTVTEPSTQIRLGKDSIGKVSKVKSKVFSDLPEWLDTATWLEWEIHRKEKKQKLTPRTIELQIKFLEKHKKDHVEIIENSIRNGWTGLFPLKDNHKKKMYVA